jgi:hypothetical protein
MSGDPLGETGELRKVLGLRWDTERDEICLDIKLNYGEKIKGAYLEDNAPLSNPESALPQVITRRILWRVAQSQYDPLGLLSVYMVRWKQLMRKVTLKGKGGGWESPLDKEEEDVQEVAEGLKRTARDKILKMHATTGRAIQKVPSYGFLRWVTGSLLHPNVPEVGEGVWYGLLSVDNREEPGSPKGENNHPEDGARGSGQLGEVEKKDQRGVENTPCRNEILYRLVSCSGHAQDGVWQVQ